jgi:glucose 1-dehydrogenase
MANLSGKVALVTGSSLGIGLGCALELARAGADVVVNYRSHPKEADAVVAEIKKLGRKSTAIQADMGDTKAVENMVQQAIQDFGRVDILINNAAYMAPRVPFHELPLDEFEKVWRVYTFGSFICTRAVVRDMVAHKRRGKILLISSIHASAPYPGSSAYNSSKGGAEQLFLTMATELAAHRINVNIIQPGWTDTPGERRFTPEEVIRESAPKLPWGRLAKAEEMGKAAVFLCSDEADYITGATLRIDGALIQPRVTAAMQI